MEHLSQDDTDEPKVWNPILLLMTGAALGALVAKKLWENHKKSGDFTDSNFLWT